ncbi:tetratricopeptide repeat protein [Silvibacterium dinghuense]|nr:tetratricopeptide repeat protein [Silvibacterium dinghuense]GGG90472.1 hypothetical protein GCM10011586_01130 [Silvibacterium dinghuense]
MNPCLRIRDGVLWSALLGVALGSSAFAQQQNQDQQSTSSSSQSANTPAQTPDAAAKKPSTAADNPFPEAISKKAAAEANAPESAKAPVKTDDGSSSSRSAFAGVASPLDNTNRISDGAGGFIHNPKMAEEDVKVGGFYFTRGDYQGAYARYKEATEVDPGNADAVLGLAKSAQGLKHTQEAVDNYRIYLDAFPDGKKARDARKALAELGAAPK